VLDAGCWMLDAGCEKQEAFLREEKKEERKESFCWVLEVIY